MYKIDKIVYREIVRISPSQFYSMKNCAYKSLLAAAFESKPLLPVSPNAYYGTVLHKMLEMITKGLIKNENDFNILFDKQVILQEENLVRLGYDFLVPLQKNVKDFGMKKVLLKKHLKTIRENPELASKVKFYSEKWLESKDKLIAGKVDLIIEDEQGNEIIDFKTGAITHDVLDDDGEIFSKIKEEYTDQLKLYAQLYFENTGKFPSKLSLIDLTKQKFAVVFTQLECESIFIEAKKLIATTNQSIIEGTYKAKPSEKNCKYCLYRPACSSFLKLLESTHTFNDVSGAVRNVVKYQNGNINVLLENREGTITVTGFHSTKYDDLNAKKDKRISIFNLRKEATELVFSTTKTTVIYE